MKKSVIIAAAFLLLAGCEKKAPQPVPVNPILMDVVMPAEGNAFPGTDITISGRGFDESDVFQCSSLSGQADFSPEVVSVTNYGVTLAVPEQACGFYKVSVTRNGLTTELPDKLYISYVFKLDGISLSAGSVRQGGKLVVSAKGLVPGDHIVFESPSYPSGVSVKVEVDQQDKVEITIPQTVYGVNTVKAERYIESDQVMMTSTLGEVKVLVDLFSQVGGGIVFYTEEDGLRGLIVHKDMLALGVNWGISLENAYYKHTSPDLWKGKENTELLYQQYLETKDEHHGGDNNVYDSHINGAYLAHNLTVKEDGVEYDDWFIPSTNELLALYRVRNEVEKAGFVIPRTDIWTSTEVVVAGTDYWVWAQGYVNFWIYPPQDPISGVFDRIGAKIGVLAIRQF